MNNIDFTNVSLKKLITHYVGNKTNEEEIILSDKISSFKEDTLDYLLQYFFSAFKPIDFYNFKHSVGLELNEVYVLANKIFDDHESFIPESKNLANLLYDYSSHPKIKSGEFNIVLFDDMVINDEVVEGIGLFKSETNAPFLKMNRNSENYSIEHEFGFEMKGIDKGCIVFNTNKENGYSLLIVDNTNRSAEAQYWMDDFLKLKPSNDDYNNTKEFMDMTKDFLTKQLPDEFEITKTEKIDLLNKTVDYFKKNDSFQKSEFEENVLQDESVINSFRAYDSSYQTDNNIELHDSFGISDQAVKKQTRKFKSILKLDKNFHVYIHGDKNLIERGVENDGRKFYKIYYERED